MLRSDVKKRGDPEKASSKTLLSHEENHQQQPDDNGYFVRPVAVANIFKPALSNVEETRQKPAIPEKRRFSLLAGDLQPCSGASKTVLSNEEFAKRRQSWDTRSSVTVPPFGQNLLKKIPKRNSVTKENELSTVNHSGSEKETVIVNGDCNHVSLEKTADSNITNKTSSTGTHETKLKSTSQEITKQEALVVVREKKDSKNVQSFKTECKQKDIQIHSERNNTRNNSDNVNIDPTPSVKDNSKISDANVNNLKTTDSLITVKVDRSRAKRYGIVFDKNVNINDQCMKNIVQNSVSETFENKKIVVNSTSESKTNLVNESHNIAKINQGVIEKETSHNVKSKNTTNLENIETSSKNCVNEVEVNKVQSNRDVILRENAGEQFNEIPKDVRTIRRTSDVIAAKIQTMFGNATEKQPIQLSSVSGKSESKLNASNKPVVPSKNSVIARRMSDQQHLSSNKCLNGDIIENHLDKETELNQNKVDSTRILSKKSPKEKLEQIKTEESKMAEKQAETVLVKSIIVENNIPAKELDRRLVTSKTTDNNETQIKFVDIKKPVRKVPKTKENDTINYDVKKESDQIFLQKSHLKENNMKLDKEFSLINSNKSEVMIVPSKKDVQTAPKKHAEKPSSSVVQPVSEKTLPSVRASPVPNVSQETHQGISSNSNTSNEIKIQKESQTPNNTSVQKKVSSKSKEVVDKLAPSPLESSVIVNQIDKSSCEINCDKTTLKKNESTLPREKMVEKPKSIQLESFVPSVTSNGTLSNESQQKNAPVSMTERKISMKNNVSDLPVDAHNASVQNVQPRKSEKTLSSNGSPIDLKNSFHWNSIIRSTSVNADYFKSAAKFDIMPANSLDSISPSPTNISDNDRSSITGSVESVGSDSKTPRPPERKRPSLFRETSVPLTNSHSATVARTSSLKRFDSPSSPGDKSLAILRSPSHNTLPAGYSHNPHRFSYTEMLSKIASYGITPSKSCTFNPPYKRYSFGSHSSSLSQVSELRSDLSHEQSSATHTSEILENETTERMRLEKEVSELQSRYSHVQQKSNKMEMEMMEARVYRSSELNGDLSDDEECEGNASIYKQKYEKAVQDMEIMKRRMQQQHEEEVEQNLLVKKAADKKLAEALEDVEEERQVANQWKRKAQKLGSELQDLRLMLEEQMGRNGELEKKQRGFDAELMSCKEEIKKERLLREKMLRERDQATREKYSLEQELHDTTRDMDEQREKIVQLTRELDELTLCSKGEEEVTQLKRAKQELERKCRDMEEELEEYVGQVQMLEQAKLRLEMSLEKLRQEHRRESSVREEEIEELRASFSKKIRNLEAQLESEQEDRHQLVKQKHELERRVIELTDQPPPQDPEIERRLRRDLKRTKALLRDSQVMLEHVRDGQGNKSVIRQLKNQLEDAEFAKTSAIKAKQAAELELQDLQTQLEEITKNKNEHESRCLQLSREKSALQTQLEEIEEEMAEVMKKYNASVAQISSSQKTIADQNQVIAELESEKNALRDQLSEVNTKFEHLAGQTEDTHRTFRLDAKVRELESKLELEQTSRSRFEHQITRLKEQIDRLQEECDSLRNKELQAQESTRRFQRQIRELREDYAALQQKESEAYRKQHDLELALENAESELKVAKNDLRLACQRVEELKNAIEDDLDSGTDVPDDSGSDSDSSLDMSTMTRPCFTPIQRCESVSSNLSYGSRRSMTPSYNDVAALCKGMWKQTSMDFLT